MEKTAPKLTVDRNVIISVINREPGYEFASRLFAAHAQKSIKIAISAANRVENNKAGLPIQSLSKILDECRQAGLDGPEILDYPLDWGMGLWEHGIVSERGYQLELALHQVLFSSVATYLADGQVPSQRRKVINAKCDVFALWGHLYFERDYFITNDGNFFANEKKLKEFGCNNIWTPAQCVESLSLSQNFQSLC